MGEDFFKVFFDFLIFHRFLLLSFLFVFFCLVSFFRKGEERGGDGREEREGGSEREWVASRASRSVATSTNQSFPVCKVDLATLRVANNQLIV